MINYISIYEESMFKFHKNPFWWITRWPAKTLRPPAFTQPAWDRWWSLYEEEPIGQDTRMASAAAQQL